MGITGTHTNWRLTRDGQHAVLAFGRHAGDVVDLANPSNRRTTGLKPRRNPATIAPAGAPFVLATDGRGRLIRR